MKSLARPLTFWTLGEIKNSAHSKVKREDWSGRKREKIGQLWVCDQARRPGRFRTGLWSTVGVNCAHLINQSMTASSRKAIVLLKNVSELDPTNSRNSSLPKIEDWISLSSDYHNFILKDTLYRKHVGSDWKWVILICVSSKPFLICLRELSSVHQWLSTIFSPALT